MSLSFTLNTPVKEMSAVKDETWPHRSVHKIQLPEPLASTRKAGMTASPSHRANVSIK